MIKAPDFDRKMLMLATTLAKESKNKTVLHAVLHALYETLRRGSEPDVEVQSLTIIR